MSNQTIDREKLVKDWVSNFEMFVSTLNGSNPEPLATARKEAINNFEKIGFPTTKWEEWKYTSVLPLLKKEFQPVFFEKEVDLSPALISSAIPAGLEAHVLVFINGFYSEKHSLLKDTQAGVRIGSVKEELKAGNELVSKNLGQIVSTEDEAYIALNTAFTQDGAFVHISKGKSMELPVFVLNVVDARNGNTLANAHNLYIVEDGAEGKIIESALTLGSDGLLNRVTEIKAGNNSRFDLFQYQNDNENGHQIGHTNIAQGRDSVIRDFTFTLGGAFNRNTLRFLHEDENCESWMMGIYLLSGEMHADNRTLVDHAKPNCYSNELYKGILGGKSTGVFNGKIIVHPDAQKTNAFQSNKNIILSDSATINTKPQLEIFADDVKCSHGATTGRLDEDAFFYLKARGVPPAEAQALLTMAFASDVTEQIPIEALRKLVEAEISARVMAELK